MHEQLAASNIAAMTMTQTSNQRGTLRLLCSPEERAISASRPHAKSSWRAMGDTVVTRMFSLAGKSESDVLRMLR
jgi:hypothetical protein